MHQPKKRCVFVDYFLFNYDARSSHLFSRGIGAGGKRGFFLWGGVGFRGEIDVLLRWWSRGDGCPRK